MRQELNYLVEEALQAIQQVETAQELNDIRV